MPQIKRGSEPITVQRRKDLALLVYLSVTSQPHSRDTLATLLWQEEGQTVARSNLRKSLSRLKRLLGEDVFLVSQDQIALHPDLSLRLDVKDFNACLEQFRKHHPDRNRQEPDLCPACRQALDKAASLYQADFLNGFLLPDSSTFDEWQFFQAESLRQNLALTLELLTHQYTSDKNFEAAITFCRRWLSLDKLHEPAQRQLMLLYALNGQAAAARRQFEECVRLLDEELHTKPEPQTLQLFEAIEKKKITGLQNTNIRLQAEAVNGKDLSTEQSKNKVHGLPSYPSPFIGREKELEEVARLLHEPAYRLLTLLGPGGSGKTRLALQAATLFSGNTGDLFQDGIYFISLAPLTDPGMMVGALFEGLKITGQVRGDNARERLLSYMQGHRILLILDNFEHLLGEESLALITEMIAAAPQSRILVTSRERLNLQGEQIFRVEGLEIPEGQTPLSKADLDSVTLTFSALKLFERCAARVQPSFAITRENYEPVVQICQMVQGMPLAIEMAASWLELFSPEEIRVEISRSLDFLQSNFRDLPGRQRSLRAVFDSSWTLLDRQTRPVLKALSVFRAGFTREAAQAVAGASAKTLLDLTNKSWLQRLSSGRYQIHELLRQFCFEKLSKESVTFEQVRKQYCEYYISFGSSLWRMMKGRDQKSAFAAIREELENFNSAWRWLIEKNQVEAAVDHLLPAVFYDSEIRDLNLEIFLLMESASQVLTAREDRRAWRRWEFILNAATFIQTRYWTYEDIAFGIRKDDIQLVWSQFEKQKDSLPVDFWSIRLAYAYGNFVDAAPAIRYLEFALPELERANQSWELANSYLYLAKLQFPQLSYSRRNEAVLERYILAALDIFTRLGDDLNVSYTRLQLGNLRYKQERPEDAIEQWTLAQAALKNLDEWLIANNLIRLIGDAYLQMGKFKNAFECFDQIARISFEHGHAQQAVGALSKESFEMVRYGDLAEARRLRQQCIEIIEASGPSYQIGWNYWEMGEILRVMGDLDEAAAWYERARGVFESTYPDEVWRIFYYRGLGDIALEREDFRSAAQQFVQSAKSAQASTHGWAMAYALHGLGRSQLGLDNIEAARQHFIEALQYAFKTGDHGIALLALAGYAQFLCREGNSGMAVALGSLVSSHYAAWRETKGLAARLLSTLKETMTLAEFEQAEKNGQSMDLQETVGNLIDWQEPPA